MEDLNKLLVEWNELKLKIEKARQEIKPTCELEMKLRKSVVSLAWPETKEGTNNRDLGLGYTLKGVVKYERKIDTKLLDEIERQFNEAAKKYTDFTFDKVLRWKPELDLAEYRKLPTELAKIVDGMVTTSPVAPTLEIVEPKEAK